VTFGEKIPKAKQIPGLDDKIAARELDGVLNWALEGAAAWREAGAACDAMGRLELPKSVVETRERYRAKTDYVARWLLECTEEGADFREARTELWASYRQFVTEAGLRNPGIDREFYEDLARRDYRRSAHAGVRVFRGLRLKGEHFK
jgi:phage/plasmid-associated DNA primase